MQKITSRTTGAKGCKFEQFLTIGSEPFSLSIAVHLVYLNLFWSVSTYLGSSRSILVQLGLPISLYYGQFRAILSYRRIFWTKFGYLGLSQAIMGYLGLYLYIMSYLGYCFENQF